MKCRTICLWLGAFVFETGVFCQTYIQITEFVGGQIALKTFPTSINNQGAIVGYWEGVPFTLHGFVRSADGDLLDLFAIPRGISPLSLRRAAFQRPL